MAVKMSSAFLAGQRRASIYRVDCHCPNELHQLGMNYLIEFIYDTDN